MNTALKSAGAATWGLFLIAALAGCGGSSGSAIPAISVSLTSSMSAVDQQQQVTITATVANDSSNSGVTFGNPTCSAAACGSLSNVTATTATYTAPANVASSMTVTITATSVKDPSKSKNIMITVNPNPAVAQPTASQLMATIGAAYSLQLAVAAGTGVGPYTFALASGTLPAGLSLNGNTGVVSGNPTDAASTPSFTVTAKDSVGVTSAASAAITISVAIPITTASLPVGEVTVAYNSQALAANTGTGTGITWSATGLPSWAGINAGTGAIAGNPTAGSSLITVTVTDANGATGSKQFTLTINSQLTITSSGTLPGGTVNTAYGPVALQASGGTPPSGNWSLATGSSLPPGLNLSTAGVISGTPQCPAATYNFMAQLGPDGSGVTATSAGLTITTTTTTLSISTKSLPSATVGTLYSQQLQSTGGACSTPVTWSLASGSNPLPAWLTLNSTGLLHGTPGASDVGGSFTVQATDGVSTPTQNLTITVVVNACGSGSESLLNAGYAFVLKGFDSSGNPALVGGVLTFNGVNNSGLITSGAIDENLATGPNINLAVTSGTYSIGPDHRGCMSITTSAGTMNFRFSVGNITAGVAATAHVIDFDATGPFVSGIMRKQSGSNFSAASANGSFAFGGSSIQNASLCNSGTGTQICGGKFAVAGVLVFNGLGGITGGSEDINQNGFLDGTVGATTWPASSPITITSGSSYTFATNGRGTLTLSFVGVPNLEHAVLYIVSSTELLFMSRDLQTTFTIVAGEALKQSGAGTFTGSSLSGAYAGYNSALGGAAGTSAVNLIHINIANPNITGTSWQNNGGVFSSGSVNATYTVASNGRVLTTGGGHPPVLYIVNSSQAFFLSSDGRIESGFFESQTGGPFSNTSASGVFAFGALDPEDKSVSDNSGVANFASPNISTTEDDNSNGSLTVGRTQNLTYSIDSATGLGGIPQGCTVSAASTTCQSLFLIVSPTKAAVMDAATTTSKVQVADQ